jgi:glycosyltransferase involved in cell wall biosynthesis
MTADGVGGVWRYALVLADALAPHGVEVTLATTGAPLRADQRAELRESAVAAARHRPFRLEWMDDPWDDLERAGDWLLELRDEVRPEVVHLNAYAHAALDWDAPRLVVGHSCVLSWFRAVRGTPAPPEWDRYARVVAAGLAAADYLVAPTRAMLAELRRLYRPTCAGEAIANGCRPAAAPAAKEPFVLGAGRLWDEAKNAAALDRAAEALPWPVLLAGDAGSERPPAHARPLGRVDAHDLAALMARAAIFAAPALYEPFGLAPLEAAQAGCALVLGDVPSLREVWGDDALYVDPRDDESLAAALRLLVSEEAMRRDLAARARERAARYTPERMAAAYLDVYRRLVAPAVEAAA